MVPCLTRLLALVTTGLLVQCAAARAQSPEPPPDTMPPGAVFDAVPAGIDRLVQGDELRIVRRDARETFGILQRVSSSALTIATETGSQDVPLDLVRRVRRRGDRVWDGLVIGAAFGAAISAATFVPCDGYASWEPCSAANFTTSRAGDALAGAAVFGLIGLGIDAAELAKGRRQQRSILSLVAPDVPGYELASHYAAARDIGGDFFELFRLHKRGNPLAIVIADVTGKGLDAALLMAFARPVMHAALNGARGPAEALERTNRVLVGERRGTLFITAVCAILEPRSGRLRVANAGHEPPLLIPGDGTPVRPVGDSGVLLGAFASITPPEVELILDPGDTLYAYTDGVTDAIDPSRRRFGDDRLAATIDGARGRPATELIATIRDAVEAFAAGTEPADDVTMLAVGRRPRRTRRATGR